MMEASPNYTVLLTKGGGHCIFEDDEEDKAIEWAEKMSGLEEVSSAVVEQRGGSMSSFVCRYLKGKKE